MTARVPIRNAAPLQGMEWIRPPFALRNRSVFRCCWMLPAQKNSKGLVIA